MPARYPFLVVVLPVCMMLWTCDHSCALSPNNVTENLLSTNFSYLGEIQLDVEAGDFESLEHLVAENGGFAQAFLDFYQGFIESVFGKPAPRPPPPQDTRLLHII